MRGGLLATSNLIGYKSDVATHGPGKTTSQASNISRCSLFDDRQSLKKKTLKKLASPISEDSMLSTPEVPVSSGSEAI